LPTLVTFADLNDPQSMRVIQPGQLEAAFGPDVRFKRIWIEITRNPVTTALEQKLPFLVSHREWMRRLYSDPTKLMPQFHLFIRS